MSDWQPNASAPASAFFFSPPRGATRVAFAPPRKTEH
jgi:hypothetical protein